MKKVKWGVIGCGGIADKRTISGILEAKNAELVAVMDINPELAEAVGKKYNIEKVFTTVDGLLACDIDAVYIATPVFCHKEQAIAAAGAGKHILIEKPVGLTAAEAKEIREIAKKENVKIGVGMMMRFHTYHQEIKRLIDEGKLGDIVSIRAKFSCWYPKIENSWRQSKKLGGGGALMDLGVHCLDILQYVSGKKAESVSAFCDNLSFGYEVDDSASILLKLEGGTHAFVDANFNIPDSAGLSRLEIYGTKGSAVAENTLSQVEEGTAKISLSDDGDGVSNQGNIKTYFLEPAEGNMYTKETESFSNSILEDSEPLVTIDDAIFVQEIAEKAYLSSEEGKVIALK